MCRLCRTAGQRGWQEVSPLKWFEDIQLVPYKENVVPIRLQCSVSGTGGWLSTKST